MYKIGFIGAGNMGSAMIQGLIKSNFEENLIFTAYSNDTKENIVSKFNIPCCSDNIQLTKDSKYIILAVKPNKYPTILKEIKSSLTKDKIVISIAPGITINTIEKLIDSKAKVVRSMPNTPALAGEGMSVVSFSGDDFHELEINDIKNIFKSFGETEILDEKLMDAVVPISGSSPAYVYMFIEAMADAGVLTGLPRKLSYKLAAQSVLGASKMVLETQMHPGELKDAVCSPGGTTIEAVHKLEKGNFRNTIIEAMISCYDKAKKIS